MPSVAEEVAGVCDHNHEASHATHEEGIEGYSIFGGYIRSKVSTQWWYILRNSMSLLDQCLAYYATKNYIPWIVWHLNYTLFRF